MKKNIFSKIVIGALIGCLVAGGVNGVALPVAAAQKTEQAQKTVAELPEYQHESEGKFYEAVYDYTKDEIGASIENYDVKIPCPIILEIDDRNTNDILVYGDFEVYSYTDKGDTLFTESGGSFAGCMHLKYDVKEDVFEVTKFDQVEDGSDYDSSAKKIFTEAGYKAFMSEQSDEKLKDDTRYQIVANYVAENNLAFTKIQDYGWDAVELPAANTDDFCSFTF